MELKSLLAECTAYDFKLMLEKLITFLVVYPFFLNFALRQKW